MLVKPACAHFLLHKSVLCKISQLSATATLLEIITAGPGLLDVIIAIKNNSWQGRRFRFSSERCSAAREGFRGIERMKIKACD